MTRLFLLFAIVIMTVAAGPGEARRVGAVPGIDLAGRKVLETAATLRPGEFIWAPEKSPSGPVLLIVNLDTQRAALFRNGVPIAASTLSTGRPGYETPTGVFTILQKHVEHYSSKYDNAPMPYMQRLTWLGVALHAGQLPGYPASHGCIRLPKEFARLLYGVTRLGMTVVVTRLPATMKNTDRFPLAASPPTKDADLTHASFEWHPERAPGGIASVIVSITDQRAVVIRDGEIIGSAPIRFVGAVNGSWAYLLHRKGVDDRQWLKLQLDGNSQGMELGKGEADRFEIPVGFRAAVLSVLKPGSIIVVTQQPLRPADPRKPVTVIEDAPAEG
jgi:hypothetical protein